MAEVLFFILGALFCLSLLAAVVALLPSAPAVAVDPVHSEPFGRNEERRISAQPRPRRARAGHGDTRALPPPGRATPHSARDREAYRMSAALDRAEAVFYQISRFQEPAAAKIASQTLRRLRSNDAPPAARLAFAMTRLELLSLRPEPLARKAAQQALSSIG